VNEIFDVISVKSDFESSLQERVGILGNVITEQHIATVVDVLGIIEDVTEEKGTHKTPRDTISSLKKRAKILFAEDTRFFVQHVQKILSELNVELVHAPDGDAAFKVLKSAADGEFDLVLSDIEMPIMNGFELAEKIRNEPKWKKLPMIALSTRFREADIKKGLEVGFNQYLEKLKADQLVEAIKAQLEGDVA
jgi:two-component system chemotaxis sensor kinase CheA